MGCLAVHIPQLSRLCVWTNPMQAERTKLVQTLPTVATKRGAPTFPPLEPGDDNEPLSQDVLEVTTMAAQISLRSLVRQALLVTDLAYVGHVGTKQLAGVALAHAWMGLPSVFVQFSIQAISTLCSQAHGAGNPHLVGVWLQTALVFAMLSAIPVTIWYIFVGEMVALTMSDADTLAFAAEFACIMTLGLLPQYVYAALVAYFAAQDVVMPATVISVITMGMNILFNQVFIHGVNGWHGLGFIGSPLAAVTSSFFQLALFVLYTIVWKKHHAPSWGGWSSDCISKTRLDVFFEHALPSGASAVVDWATITVASTFSGYLGPEMTAALAVMTGFFGVVAASVSGFTAATQIRTSRYLSRGGVTSAIRVCYIGAAIVLAMAVVWLLILVSFLEPFFHLWTNDDAIVSLGADATPPFLASMFIACVRFLLTACVNAVSKADLNFMANNVASWLIFIPLSYMLPIGAQWGIRGFWWADAIGEFVKTAILLRGLSHVNWPFAAREAQRAAERSNSIRSEENETREVNTIKVEMMFLTPRSFNSPSYDFSTTPRTPKAFRRPKNRSRSAANPSL
ncbi:unnamed protein product [Aphanomyces euteiches]